jgi:hypothetical protein
MYLAQDQRTALCRVHSRRDPMATILSFKLHNLLSSRTQELPQHPKSLGISTPKPKHQILEPTLTPKLLLYGTNSLGEMTRQTKQLVREVWLMYILHSRSRLRCANPQRRARPESAMDRAFLMESVKFQPFAPSSGASAWDRAQNVPKRTPLSWMTVLHRSFRHFLRRISIKRSQTTPRTFRYWIQYTPILQRPGSRPSLISKQHHKRSPPPLLTSAKPTAFVLYAMPSALKAYCPGNSASSVWLACFALLICNEHPHH